MKTKTVFQLSIKELWSLWRDPAMLILIVYVFTLNIYTAATAVPETLHNAPIAFVDHDQSQLSRRVIDAFVPPYFLTPEIIEHHQVNEALDTGLFTFVVTIPPNFEKEASKGLTPDIQVNVDATRISQAFTGNGYITEIINDEVGAYLRGYKRSGGVARYANVGLLNHNGRVGCANKWRHSPIYGSSCITVVCGIEYGNFYGYHRPFHAAVWAAAHISLTAASTVVRGHHTQRKYA